METERPERDASGKFLPGNGGGGRPAVVKHIRELAQQHSPEAMQTLVACLNDEKGAVRVAAAQAILDRAYGKAPQAITGADGEGPALIVVKQFVAPNAA